MELFLLGEVEEFISTLEKPTIAKVLRTIDLLECFGHQLCPPHCKKVTSGVYELRIRGSQEIRLFYTFQGGKAILFHGFIKKSQKIPTRELRTVMQKLDTLDKI